MTKSDAAKPAAAKRAAGRAPRRGWRMVRRIAAGVGLLMLAPVPFILLFALVHPPMTAVMAQQTMGRLFAGTKRVWPTHTPVSHAAISNNLRRAVLASEDDRFYLHHGIDFVEINRALDRKKRGGSLRGASTLTQQVAKNIFLWNGRSFVRKGLELYVTLWLERLLSKDRILDLYLNLAEWGPGVYGAEAAAQTHFGKRARALTRDESARLAAILPSPKRWPPQGRIATQRSRTILGRMQYASPRQ